MKNIYDLIDRTSKLYNDFELDFNNSNKYLNENNYKDQVLQWKAQYPEQYEVFIEYFEPQIYETDDLLPKFELEVESVCVDYRTGKLIDEVPLWYKALEQNDSTIL